jgi:hypothetical protein
VFIKNSIRFFEHHVVYPTFLMWTSVCVDVALKSTTSRKLPKIPSGLFTI